MADYKIGNYVFKTQEEYDKAKKELLFIKQASERYNTNDPQIAKRILEKFKPETVIGRKFCNKLRTVCEDDKDQYEEILKSLESDEDRFAEKTESKTPSTGKKKKSKLPFIIIGFCVFCILFYLLDPDESTDSVNSKETTVSKGIDNSSKNKGNDLNFSKHRVSMSQMNNAIIEAAYVCGQVLNRNDFCSLSVSRAASFGDSEYEIRYGDNKYIGLQYVCDSSDDSKSVTSMTVSIIDFDHNAPLLISIFMALNGCDFDEAQNVAQELLSTDCGVDMKFDNLYYEWFTWVAKDRIDVTVFIDDIPISSKYINQDNDIDSDGVIHTGQEAAF